MSETTIGLISDTHGYLDPKVAAHFSSCDEIWHAGDIGTIEVLDALSAIAPVKAVYGNVDGHELRLTCPETICTERGGLKILMIHIAGRPGKYNARVRELLAQHQPGVIVCGHSHILKVIRDPHYRNLLYINPGAAGRHGFHHQKTIMRMTVSDSLIKNLEVIELGKRGSVQ